MLSLLSGSDPIEVKTVIVTIFGQPGVCKTSLGYSADERPLLLDFDGGAHRAINRREGTTTVRMESWADLQALYRDHKEEIAQHGAVVIDTVGRCLDMIAAEVIRENPKMGQSDGSLAMKGWGALKSKWGAFEKASRALGVDLILIAHDKEKDEGDAKSVRPDIQGGSYGEVIKTSDAIGYCYISGRQRTLDFNPSDRWIGKNPAAWAPFPVPNFAQEPLFLRLVLDQLKAHLNDRAQANADATKAAEVWWERLGGIEDVQKLNELLPEVNGLKNPLRAQVASMVNDHAKAKGWAFDKKAKTFAAPAPAEEEQAAFA
jgi:hypothetical protein